MFDTWRRCHVVLPLPELVVRIEAQAFAFSNQGDQNFWWVSKHHGLHVLSLTMGTDNPP